MQLRFMFVLPFIGLLTFDDFSDNLQSIKMEVLMNEIYFYSWIDEIWDNEKLSGEKNMVDP